MSGYPAAENPPAAGRFRSRFLSAHQRLRKSGALDRIICIGLLIGAMALVGWVRLLPRALRGVEGWGAIRLREMIAAKVDAQLPADIPDRRAAIDQGVRAWMKDHPAKLEEFNHEIVDRLASEFRYTGDDGREHAFLGDYDSYHWLRMARNYLQTGTTCDRVVDGICRDTYANAPVGRTNIYNRSPHIAAIIALNRLITFFRPGFPIPASSFLVQALIGMLGVIPAFAIGRRVAGNLGGLSAAIVLGLNPTFLERSLGSDDDVWNVVLPLFMVWALVEASAAQSSRRQIAYATLGAVFTGLHAATWSGWSFTYGVLMIALLANLFFESIKLALCRARSELSSGAGVRRAALVVAVFYFAAWITTSLAGASYSATARNIARPIAAMLRIHPGGPHVAAHARPSPPGESVWPHTLSIVAELQKVDPTKFARWMGGQWVPLAGCLGLLLLALPQRRWRWWDFALLIGAAGLYRYGLAASLTADWQLPALIAAPIAVAILIDLMPTPQAAPQDRSAALIVSVWFCAALYLGSSAGRFVMLLAAPFAIAFGAIPGRAYLWISRRIRERQPRYAGPLSAAVFVALAAWIIVPAEAGYLEARNYMPIINHAWWMTLEDLREHSPPDAIINAQFDYGYWIKYVADRRVAADGGSLSTHIPYWLSRALLAPNDNQAVGLLRMLDCGSDATPDPEGKLGAYGKLIADGLDPIAAQSMVLEIAGLDFPAASARLARSRLGEAAQAGVLASTHCDPPPAYLILSSKMAYLKWSQLGNWDFRRAYAYANERSIPQAAAVEDLAARFGLAPADARTLFQQVRGLRSDQDAQRFIAPVQPHSAGWIPCRSLTGGELDCTPDLSLSQRATITGIVYRPTDTTLKIRFLSDDGKVQDRDGTPALVLIAGDKEIAEHPVDSPTDPDVAVMVDPARSRALIGPPNLIRSTFTRLMLLDGAYSPLFTKVYENTVIYFGEKVTAWKINWPELERSGSAPNPKKPSAPSPGA